MPTVAASLAERVEVVRNAKSLRGSSYASGKINHDSVVYLAKYILGKVNNAFHVAGAVRCSGASAEQIEAIIALTEKLAPTAPEVDAVLQLVVDELRIPLAPHCRFPAIPPESQGALETSSGRPQEGTALHSQSPIRRDLSATDANALTSLTPHEIIHKAAPEAQKPPSSAVTTAIAMACGLFLLAVFAGFFVLWFKEGWSLALSRNPFGGALFFLSLGAIYILAIPVLRDKGFRSLSNMMLTLAIIAAVTFVVGYVPSCSNDEAPFSIDRPYRK